MNINLSLCGPCMTLLNYFYANKLMVRVLKEKKSKDWHNENVA